MLSLPTAQDIIIKENEAAMIYGIAAFAGSYAGSIIGSYRGRTYELIGFLAGGEVTTLAYHFFDLLRGYSQSAVSNSCKKVLFITMQAAVINSIHMWINPQNSYIQKTLFSYGIVVIIPIVYRIASG